MSELRTFAITLFSALAAFLEPIAQNAFAMFYFLAVNFVIGLLVSLLVEHETFSWRKAGWCAIEALIFFGLISSIYIIGRFQGNMDAAITVVSIIVYVGGWFYGVRIFRNLRRFLHPGSPMYNTVDFVYSVMSLEIAGKIPGLKEYINRNKILTEK